MPRRKQKATKPQKPKLSEEQKVMRLSMMLGEDATLEPSLENIYRKHQGNRERLDALIDLAYRKGLTKHYRVINS